MRDLDEGEETAGTCISCDVHRDTWHTGYKYMTEAECQKKYNSHELEFSECFDNTHVRYHNEEDPDFDVGKVDTRKENYMLCEREYGAWNGSTPPATLLCNLGA